MGRAARVLTPLGLVLVTWAVLVADVATVASAVLQVPDHIRQLILPLPLWLLIALASYALMRVGWRLMFFPECAEKAAALSAQVKEAEAFYKSKGIDNWQHIAERNQDRQINMPQVS